MRKVFQEVASKEPKLHRDHSFDSGFLAWFGYGEVAGQVDEGFYKSEEIVGGVLEIDLSGAVLSHSGKRIGR